MPFGKQRWQRVHLRRKSCYGSRIIIKFRILTIMKFPPWHQRPDEFDPETHREGILDSQSFLRVADQFISLANQRNKKIESTELQMVMLYAAARYAAHVGKNVLNIEEQEDFVQHMVAQYTDMLREHMADPTV
jgi:hypothetical protein